MLNLFNNMSKGINSREYNEYLVKSFKHFPSSAREWESSIYSHNRNCIDLTPNSANSAMNLLRGFFSLFDHSVEKNIRTRNIRSKFKKLSSNKIYISNGKFKYTNNKVVITLYLFNRQKNNYLYFLRKIYLNAFFNVFENKRKKIIRYSLIKRLEVIKNKSLLNIKHINVQKYYILKSLKYGKHNSIYIHLSRYIDSFYSKFVDKCLKKMKLYFFYRQILFVNKSKYTYNYLQYLKNPLYQLFNRNIEFNLVSLKQFYLDSDILSESLLLKLTKNRRKILKYLTSLRNKVNISSRTIKPTFLINMKKKLYTQRDLTLNDGILGQNIVDNLKYKHVSGFKIEAKGRLSKRYTASRSILKTKHKGNLLNIDSSYRGLSSVMLKGNLKSNLQSTKLRSKSRIGSFGIKG